MQKLYKYRSLSPFLYKELLYQEVYFASCAELNDPLDLNIPVTYNIAQKEDADFLAFMLFKNTLVFNERESKSDQLNDSRYVQFINDEEKHGAFVKLIFQYLSEIQGDNKLIYADSAKEAIDSAIKESGINFSMNVPKLFAEIDRLSKLFLKNSYVTCFSDTPDNYLMWSHYAGSHMGICLEFNLSHKGKFLFEKEGKREFTERRWQEGFAKGTSEKYIYEENLFPVRYIRESPNINFFDFAPVFENEYDVDLINLTKSHWHNYAYQLQDLFKVKTPEWAYEKEWRAIQINFKGPQEPEERVRHYPIEALNAIYFGANTPNNAKIRIANIYKKKHANVLFFACKISDGGLLRSEPWEFSEE